MTKLNNIPLILRALIKLLCSELRGSDRLVLSSMDGCPRTKPFNSIDVRTQTFSNSFLNLCNSLSES